MLFSGLTQSYIFKERLLRCEPIDLGRFVVDLRERHLDYWTPNSDMHPRERSSKHSTYHQWCDLPTKRAIQKRKVKKNHASSKKLLTSIKEKGPLGKKSPFTRKEESSQ